jgi:hypothetical protein
MTGGISIGALLVFMAQLPWGQEGQRERVATITQQA